MRKRLLLAGALTLPASSMFAACGEDAMAAPGATGRAATTQPPRPNAPFLSQRDVARLPVDAAQRIPYGPDAFQFGDLRLPAGRGPHPLVIVIHGGCWLSAFADLDLTAPLATALTRAGMATWNIEFRRVDNPGGGWPGTLLDVGSAVDKVRDLARDHPIDLDRVVVVGNSAGGQLALWAAARHRVPPESALFVRRPLRVDGAVNLGGVADLIAYHRESPVCGAPIPKLLGGALADVPERLRAASPAEMLPLGVRQIFVAGAHDTIVRPDHARRYVEAARRSGDDAHLVLVDDAAHFEVIAPGSSAWPQVESAIARLLADAK